MGLSFFRLCRSSRGRWESLRKCRILCRRGKARSSSFNLQELELTKILWIMNNELKTAICGNYRQQMLRNLSRSVHYQFIIEAVTIKICSNTLVNIQMNTKTHYFYLFCMDCLIIIGFLMPLSIFRSYNQNQTYHKTFNSVMRRSTTMKEVLPTIKRICVEQQELAYSQGKTYKQNGLLLKHKLTDLRIKTLVSTFVRKLRRNLVSSAPTKFQIRSVEEENEKRVIQATGWDIEDRFQGLMMVLDIIMSLTTFFISSFQGFLYNFREEDSSSAAIVILKIIALVIFSIRMLISLLAVTYEDDTLYLYITDIIKKELMGGSIFINIFAIVMVAVSLPFHNNETVGIVFFFSTLFKLALIRSNLKILEIMFIDSIKKFYIWNLLRVIIFNIIFAHTIATALLATSRISPESNWIQLKLVNNGFVQAEQTWFKVYIWTYYWACTIMMTVGFGDITPVDYRESIVVAFIQIFSSIVLAYNISEVGSIVSSMRKSSQQLQRKLGVLRRMLRKNPLPQEFQQKIQSYLSHQIQIRDRFEYDQHREIIENLPQQFKQEYFILSNQTLYASIPVFRYFQKETLAKLNRAFTGKVYYPGEYILKFKAGTQKIIIMRSGEFGLTFWKPNSKMNGSIIQSIKIQDQKTGLLLTTNILVRGNRLNYDIMAQKYSYGMQIPSQTFLDIIRQSSIDYYFYRSVLDKHQKMPNTYDYAECEYCENEYHTKFQCTRLHYIPTKSETIWRNRNQKGINAVRNQRYRKKKNGTHVYYMRKTFFDLLEKALTVSREDQNQEDQFNVDEPHDFFMYFKECNPDILKGKGFAKSKASKKLGTVIMEKLKYDMLIC